MPLPRPLQLTPTPAPTVTPIAAPKRTLASRFDVEPPSLTLKKRLKSDSDSSFSLKSRIKHEPLTSSGNPLSDSDYDSMDIVELTPESNKKKKKKASMFKKYSESIGQTAEELSRRDARMQRFAEINERGTPPRVDTPDYMRDAQIAASLVPPHVSPLSMLFASYYCRLLGLLGRC